MTEKEKMLTAQLYDASDPVLVAERLRCAEQLHRFNQTQPAEVTVRKTILQQLFGAAGQHLQVEASFKCDYGYNIFVGEHFFANYNCVILDVMPVHIGTNVMFGPAVQIYTATHPLDPDIRREGPESAKGITIGNDCWIGGGAIICPGVTIGNEVTIGAGSVVTRDIPNRVFAAGNPCRVIKEI